jgi:hypothetical protein
VVVVAVIGAGFHLLGSDSSSTASDTAAAQSHPENQSVGVSYGDSPAQVLAKVGSPTKKQAACWIYSAKAHTVRGAYLGKFTDALRYCFGDGPAGGKAVSAIEVHIVPHTQLDGKWYPGGWNHAVVVLAAPPPPS